MKKQLCLVIIAAAVMLGCATTPTARQLGIIKICAYNGTYLAIIEKPEWKPAFVVAEKELRTLSASTNALDMAEVVAVVNRLPVKELKSPQARLFITNGALLLQELGGGEIPAERVASTRQVAAALADGIKLATE
jgi:hypothetical protein